MFLKCSERRKNGKVHRSWSVVESHRYAGGKIAQRHVIYLGEINDSQRLAWERTIAVFDEDPCQVRQLSLFPADRTPPLGGADAVQVRLDAHRDVDVLGRERAALPARRARDHAGPLSGDGRPPTA